MYHVYVMCRALYSTAWTAGDDMEHEHGAVSIFDLLFFSVLIRYCFVKPRHSHYHDMGSIGGSVPVIA